MVGAYLEGGPERARISGSAIGLVPWTGRDVPRRAPIVLGRARESNCIVGTVVLLAHGAVTEVTVAVPDVVVSVGDSHMSAGDGPA